MQQDLQQLKLLSIFYYVWGGLACLGAVVGAISLFVAAAAMSSLPASSEDSPPIGGGLDLRDLGNYGRREIPETSGRLCVLFRGLHYHVYYQFSDRHSARYLRNCHLDAAYRESVV
jgi:hypothetical protein